MSRVRARGEEVRRFILGNVQANPSTICKLAADRFGVSRQAVNEHLRRLVAAGALTEVGQTRGRVYTLAPLEVWERHYTIEASLAEDVVWRADVSGVLGKLPENVRDIWYYGFTEMFNNAIDHSGGTAISVHVTKTAVSTEMIILDDGIGIFRKIQQALQLLDERHAIFELAKGKLTTDPQNHTGQGIFFTSRVFDGFDILSGGVFYSHEFGKPEDWLSERKNPRHGTAIFMKLGNHTARTTKKVFDQYLSGEPDDYGFNKTVVPVELAQYGNDKLISRSQAKRVLARVELFKKVILDFEKVPTIGQAFADEMFRVFPQQHPDVQLIPIKPNSDVKRMILRAVHDAATSASPGPSPEPPAAEWHGDGDAPGD
jgi:DNA-binding transcriptional ArsR family regulator